MQTVFYSIVSAVILLLQVSECRGDVMVFDAVTTLDHPIFIRVLTKGRFFPAGGKRVTVHIGKEAPQPMLTGGDGYGRLKYVPTKTGMIKLVVKYGPETDTANLLVMDKEDRALLVEIDAGLRGGLFSPHPLPDSREVLDTLSRKYRLIYLHGMIGRYPSKKWLEANRYPEGIILKNRGATTVRLLHQRKVHMIGIVGSSKLASAAAPYVQIALAFEVAPDVTTVDGWEEIQNVLKTQKSPKPN
jgi:hypothetical protein